MVEQSASVLTTQPLVMHSIGVLIFSLGLSIAQSVHAVAPTVKLDDATFTGQDNGTLSLFLGIPYAKPPQVIKNIRCYPLAYMSTYSIGDLRLRLPVPLPPYTQGQSKNVSAFGISCPQQPITIPAAYHDGTIPSPVNDSFLNSLVYSPPEGEDCLTIDVIAPANATSSSKLPVLVVRVPYF